MPEKFSAFVGLAIMVVSEGTPFGTAPAYQLIVCFHLNCKLAIASLL
jgi:hypothetical protein